MVEVEATAQTNHVATVMALQPQQHPPVQYNLVAPDASDISTQQGVNDTEWNI